MPRSPSSVVASAFVTRTFPVALAAIASLGSAACAKLPEGRSAVDSVTVKGASNVDGSLVLDELATAPSPKFLGLFRGAVYEYEIFDPYALQRDLARVERYYRARGYYDAHARAGRIEATSNEHVRIEIQVEEGQPILNDTLAITGTEALPKNLARSLERSVQRKLRVGKPFDEDDLEDAETRARRVLTDAGFAYAKVTSDVNVDLVHHRAHPTFVVAPGDPATFGKITFTGLARAGGPGAEIPEDPLRRAIDIQEGDPYSTQAVEAAQQALLDLGVFSSVELTPELPDVPPASHVVPLEVHLEPTKLRALRLGGGIEFDQLKSDAHVLTGWEDHNFAGGLRDFSIDLKPGVVLYPLRLNHIVAPEKLLPEERLRIQLRQPGFLEGRTNGVLRAEVNTFPLLVKTDPAPEDPVVGYIELRGAEGVDRSYGKLFTSLTYNQQVEVPFEYAAGVSTNDNKLSTVVIAYPELVTQLDFRDSRIHPHVGAYLSNSLQVAGGPFLGDTRDVKVQPEIRTYVPIGRRLTWATRATMGFLFPSSYGGIVGPHLGDSATPDTLAERVKDIQRVFFRGLFSGGPNSNRGFPLRGVAPHGVVPYLNPSTASAQVLNCEPTAANHYNPDSAQCLVPIGGFTLWELSTEARIEVSGPFSVAIFCDASDVSLRTASPRFDHLHLSCGSGARYDTPVGPIRLDIGYRVPPLQVLGQPNEYAAFNDDHREGIQPRLFGQPIAVAIGIGEAF